MPENKRFSQNISVFQERTAPEPGILAGYGALIRHYGLRVPLPDKLTIISQKHRIYETDEWIILPASYEPEDSMWAHLTFALKYEGVDPGVLKALFKATGSIDVTRLILGEQLGQYSRRIWFLYEWLLDVTLLDIPDLKRGNYINAIDEEIQFGIVPVNSKRHRVRNNMPGTREFCPLVRRTQKIQEFLDLDLSARIKTIIGKIHPDIMARTAAFLLLKDSKASYAIEGESPPTNRAQRWGRAIGQAGEKPISKEELERLQQIVIDDPRFIKMGLRKQEGFIGEHDRTYGTPLPDHISARSRDLEELMDGLIETDKKLEADTIDAVIAAAVIAFGFVFIHPFVDGNGRLHRYLLHHVLLRKGYVSKGIIFPVSAIILERLEEYRRVLEHFSKPRLDLIEWKTSADNNVEITNETIDLYRYFDATKQTEFLYSCVQQTIEKTVPEEIEYLNRYDRLKQYLDNYVEMPDKTVSLLVRFLEQGKGKLSERAKTKEFAALTPDEINSIEEKYKEIWPVNN